MDGKYTGKFGFWLVQYLGASSRYSVYHDHGNKLEDSTVLAIKGFFGQEITNKNRLTDVDVMVVNNDSSEIELLIEIEENSMQPKKQLGDIFATLMCNHFAVRIGEKNKIFAVSSKTRLIVAGVEPNQRNEKNITEEAIKNRFQEFTLPDDSIQINRINILTGRNISETLKKLTDEIKIIFPTG